MEKVVMIILDKADVYQGDITILNFCGLRVFKTQKTKWRDS